MGSDARGLVALRNPVEDVSASDMMPGSSSSISRELLGEVSAPAGLIIQLGTAISSSSRSKATTT